VNPEEAGSSPADHPTCRRRELVLQAVCKTAAPGQARFDSWMRHDTMDGGLLAGQRGSEPRLRRFDSCPSSSAPPAGAVTEAWPSGSRRPTADREGSRPRRFESCRFRVVFCGGLSRVRTTGRCLENSWGQGCPVRVRVPGPPPGRRHQEVAVVCNTTDAGAGPAGDSTFSYHQSGCGFGPVEVARPFGQQRGVVKLGHHAWLITRRAWVRIPPPPRMCSSGGRAPG
jgi:hypothetical protein